VENIICRRAQRSQSAARRREPRWWGAEAAGVWPRQCTPKSGVRRSGAPETRRTMYQGGEQ